MALPNDINGVVDDLRAMRAKGAPEGVLQDYAGLMQRRLSTTADLIGMMDARQQHPENMPGEAPHVPYHIREASNLPLAGLRDIEQRMMPMPKEADPEAPRRGYSGLLSAVAGAAAPPTLALQALAGAGGAASGSLLGSALNFAKQDRPTTGADWRGAAKTAAGEGAMDAAFTTLTFGMGKFLDHIRGAKSSSVQELGKEYARNVRKSGEEMLPAPAEDFAERTFGGSILGENVRGSSIAAKFWYQKMGQRAARFIDEHLRQMGGVGGEFVDPANASRNVADWIESTGRGRMPRWTNYAKRATQELQEGKPYLDDLFSEGNDAILRTMRQENPQLFNGAVAGWLKGAMDAVPTKVAGRTFYSVDGAGFRGWFVSNRKMIDRVLGEDVGKTWDGFTAWLAFGSRIAEDAFDPTSKAFTRKAVPYTMSAFLGAPSLGAWDAITGSMTAAMSNPNNPIYRLFSGSMSEQAVRQAADALGIVRASLHNVGAKSDLPYGRPPGSQQPMREPRPGDVRYGPAPFPDRPPRMPYSRR